MSKSKNWTPEEIKDKKAESLQLKLYGAGSISGVISWLLFKNHSDDAGGFFALVAIIVFTIGSIIKTTYKKKAQANIYVKDKKTEALRVKFLIAGIISGIISFIAFNNDGEDAGGVFVLVSIGALLVAGLMPVKWVKRGEIGSYHK